MYKRILVPVDGSDTSNQALTAALSLAREASGNVRVVHCFDEIAFMSGYEFDGGAVEAAREYAGELLKNAAARAETMKVPADTQLLESGGRRIGDVVAEAAKTWNADLVVVGTHGRRGVSRALLGSGAEQIIRMADVPVLVIRGHEAKS